MKKSILNFGKPLTSKEQQKIHGGDPQGNSSCNVLCENGVCWEVDELDQNTVYNGC